jgi:hypothetical protein
MSQRISLNSHQLHELNEGLHYLKMNELKDICTAYALPIKSKKSQLINAIMAFIKTGEILQLKQIPDISKTKKGMKNNLDAQALMLNGLYKNDAKTRAFFKSLMGKHFHFTAFGVDWLNERWLAGNPPTYQEFANFWQEEYDSRKKIKASPKKEWAYINFVQRFLESHPDASRAQVILAWENERKCNINKVKILLNLH